MAFISLQISLSEKEGNMCKHPLGLLCCWACQPFSLLFSLLVCFIELFFIVSALVSAHLSFISGVSLSIYSLFLSSLVFCLYLSWLHFKPFFIIKYFASSPHSWLPQVLLHSSPSYNTVTQGSQWSMRTAIEQKQLKTERNTGIHIRKNNRTGNNKCNVGT